MTRELPQKSPSWVTPTFVLLPAGRSSGMAYVPKMTIFRHGDIKAMPSPTSLHVNTSGHSAKKNWRMGSKPPYPSVHNQITGMCSSLFIPSIPNGTCRCSLIPMCCGRSKVFRSAPPDPHLVQSGVQQVLLEAHTSCLEWMP